MKLLDIAKRKNNEKQIGRIGENIMTTLQKQQVTARITPETRAILKQAAHIKGISLAQFLIQSAIKEAQVIIEYEKISLSKRDAEIITNLINNPPAPNIKMCEAVKFYQQSELNNAQS